MKIQNLLNGLQLILLIFLSYQLITLKQQVAEQHSKPPIQSNKTIQPQESTVSLANSKPLSDPLDAATVREIVAQEVNKALSSLALDNEQYQPNPSHQSNTVDSTLIAQINNQMIGYMSDGVISESELTTIERSMADMTPQERQKVIQLLAKNASNYSAIITH